MASELVRAAWREWCKAKKAGHAVPGKYRRIINEYAREYLRKKRAVIRHVPDNLFNALRERGVSANLINRNSKLINKNRKHPLARYLIIGIITENGCKNLAIICTATKADVLSVFSDLQYGAILIDLKEIQ